MGGGPDTKGCSLGKSSRQMCTVMSNSEHFLLMEIGENMGLPDRLIMIRQMLCIC